ncbi:uL15 family ribosomal protein [Candidatus Woesearchaeota archaeon]|nr:uL15 family ribosomal protein [Candidatus Woesearchaeota archaeon]
MTVNKRKKNSRMHGSHTHGWGAKKKHRGAGHRGGRGNAGTGKRADSKKPCIWALDYFGKYGFKKKNANIIKAINIHYLENHINSLLNLKKAVEKSNVFIIDLSKMGFNKLLSKGLVSKKFNITVDAATAKAIEKIEKAGGSVKVTLKSNKSESSKDKIMDLKDSK